MFSTYRETSITVADVRKLIRIGTPFVCPRCPPIVPYLTSVRQDLLNLFLDKGVFPEVRSLFNYTPLITSIPLPSQSCELKSHRVIHHTPSLLYTTCTRPHVHSLSLLLLVLFIELYLRLHFTLHTSSTPLHFGSSFRFSLPLLFSNSVPL